jgi:predicted nucleic acid-binding protein
VIYCDTSFLVSLYFPRDAFGSEARKIASDFEESIPYSLLAELELITAAERLTGARQLSLAENRDIFSRIRDDLANGLLEPCSFDLSANYQKAIRLAKEHNARARVRTLDILHIATALQLEAKTLISFDNRQRKLAGSVGLALLPKQFSNAGKLLG